MTLFPQKLGRTAFVYIFAQLRLTGTKGVEADCFPRVIANVDTCKARRKSPTSRSDTPLDASCRVLFNHVPLKYTGTHSTWRIQGGSESGGHPLL